MRRQFSLPEADESFLETLGLQWEAIIENNMRWLFLYGYLVPEGYNHRHVTLAINIGSGYPDAQLDMVFFFPGLARTDGKGIAALSLLTVDAKSFQRWSRHRTPLNPWRPGEDDIASHLVLVDYWLEREFKKD
jgi:hypothetical protein